MVGKSCASLSQLSALARQPSHAARNGSTASQLPRSSLEDFASNSVGNAWQKNLLFLDDWCPYPDVGGTKIHRGFENFIIACQTLHLLLKGSGICFFRGPAQALRRGLKRRLCYRRLYMSVRANWQVATSQNQSLWRCFRQAKGTAKVVV